MRAAWVGQVLAKADFYCILKCSKVCSETQFLAGKTHKMSDTPSHRYNLVVIGGGLVGLAVSAGAAELGARVALIECHRLGGDSLHAGSAPTTALVRAARVAAELRHAESFGLRVPSGIVVDFPAVMDGVRSLHAQLAERYSGAKLAELGVELLRGEARFVDRTHVEVGGTILEFARAVIATGAQPTVPSIPGLEPSACLTATNLFTLAELPKRLAIIGAGTFGAEMAQVFARFGSKVALFDQHPQSLPHADPDVADLVRHTLEHDGVTFRLGYTELHAEKTETGCVLHARCGEHWFADPVDYVLLAAGRTPRTAGLNLEAADVRYDENGIWVTPILRTSSLHILAAGSVCAAYQLPYAAEALAKIVIANALFFAADRAADLLVPSCTFTDPEVAHVGVTQPEAAEMKLRTLTLPFDDLDRAVLDRSEHGLLKIHHDKRGKIFGATLVCAHASEMIGEIALAMQHDVRLSALAAHIHPYPTQAEIIGRAAEAYRRSLVTPFMFRFLKRFLKWRR
jgi:pyruvate/2-oxoglutarate dehydrogenase complex dihydrolipoamide dehydrogenase (E3) component